jgi:hypothetical protein
VAEYSSFTGERHEKQERLLRDLVIYHLPKGQTLPRDVCKESA